jgi:hypothetical protein
VCRRGRKSRNQGMPPGSANERERSLKICVLVHVDAGAITVADISTCWLRILEDHLQKPIKKEEDDCGCGDISRLGLRM